MRNVLVTGSAKRVGKCIQQHFAALGDRVWIHYNHSESAAQALVAELKADGITADCIQANISQRDEVDRMFEQIHSTSGPLDVLVNNVGLYLCGDLLEYPEADFEQTIQTNLLGAYYCIQSALTQMRSGANIINIGYSGLSSLAAQPDSAAYVISKLGLLSLTKSYAVALGPKGIRCNMVSPGQVNNSVALPEGFDQMAPLKRAGTPDDIAQLVTFLCSDKASYITGQNIDVAGGYMLELQDHLP